MKKALPIIAALVFFPLSAQAEWSYDISGSATGLYGYSDLEDRFDDKQHHSQATGTFALNSALNYEYDQNYSLSLNLDLMAGIDHHMKNYNQGVWGEEAYGIFDAPAGRLMIGQTTNVAAQFHQGAPSFGPIKTNNSSIVDFIHNPNWVRDDKSTVYATLNSTAINTDGVAPKISYITPEFYNTLVGFSYVPDTYNRRGLVNKHADYQDDNGYVVAIYHSHDLGLAELAASAGYAQFHDDDKEYSVGLNLTKGNWTVGGSYRKTYIDGHDKSRPQPVSERTPLLFDNYREGNAWDVGVGYEIGPYKTSLSFIQSMADRTKNKDKIVVLANQYQVNKWLDVYLIGSYAKFEGNNDSLRDNSTGYAAITGISLSF